MDPKTVKTVKLTIYVTLALLSSVAFIVNGWMLQTALYHCTLFHVVSGILILTSLFGISFFGYLISVRNMPPRVEEPTPKRVLSASELWARRGRAAGLGAVYCCAGVCLMIAIVISIVLVIARSASLPDTSSTLIYSGLHHAVKVEYEDNGVPHIIADDMHDLYFAQGVVIAQHRLWQLLFTRAASVGRLSEIVGDLGVDVDVFSRTFRFHQIGREVCSCMEPGDFAELQAFADGINAYIDDDPAVPIEMQILGYTPQADWTPYDTCAVLEYYSFVMSTRYFSDLNRYRAVLNGMTSDRLHALYPRQNDDFPSAYTPEDVIALYGDVFSTSYNTTPDAYDVGAPPRTNPLPIPGITWRASSSHLPDMYTDVMDAYREMKSKGVPRETVKTNSLNDRINKALKADARGSNAYAVSGSKTSSNKSMVFSDPHLWFYAPPIWYLAHLSVPNLGHDAMGVTFAGGPGVIIGRNTHVAWGITLSFMDVQDAFLLQPDPSDPNRYLIRGGPTPASLFDPLSPYRDLPSTDVVSVPYEIITETIKVSGQDDKTISIRMSEFGPVVSDLKLFVNDFPDNNPWPVTFATSRHFIPRNAQMCGSLGTALLRMNKVDSAASFISVMEQHMSMPPLGISLADDNNIAHIVTGWPIERSFGYPSDIPVPSTSSQYKWLNIKNHTVAMKSINPIKGYVFSTNNKIFPQKYNGIKTVFSEVDITPTEDFLSFRNVRINDLLRSTDDIDIDIGKKIQTDTMSNIANDVVPALSNTLPYLHGNALKWMHRIIKWDRMVSSDSGAEALLFERLYDVMREHAYDETDVEYFSQPEWSAMIFDGRNNDDPICTRQGHSNCYQFLAAEFENVLEEIVEFYGVPEDPDRDVDYRRYGESNLFSSSHLAFTGSVLGCLFDRQRPGYGDESCVTLSEYEDHPYDAQDGPLFGTPTIQRDVFLGPSYRHIVDFGHLQDSKFIMPMGQSGNIFDQHYDNLYDKYVNKQYIDMKTRDYNVDATQEMEPK